MFKKVLHSFIMVIVFNKLRLKKKLLTITTLYPCITEAILLRIIHTPTSNAIKLNEQDICLT